MGDHGEGCDEPGRKATLGFRGRWPVWIGVVLPDPDQRSSRMKKTFPLQAPGRDDARVRDKIRHEINRDVRRQRRRPLPEGFNAWEFDCRIGATQESAERCALKDLGKSVDLAAEAGATQVYLEISGHPAQRTSQAG